MTLRDTDEAHVALLVAGAICAGAGLVVATLPAGLGLGIVAIIVGIVIGVVTARSAARDWRRPARRGVGSGESTGRRFWDARTRLESVMGVSAGMGGSAAVLSLLPAHEERWSAVVLSAAVFVPAAIAWAIVRKRSARRTK